VAKSWGYDDGSSAFVVHIWKNSIFAASAGDSKGFLFTDGGELEMNDKDTQRGLGHLPFKEVVDEEGGTKLSPVPCVKEFDILALKANFFVVGTWTFWQGVTVDDVKQAVNSALTSRKPEQTLESCVGDVARDLVFKASAKNTNNTSCIVCVLEMKETVLILDNDV
jgi:serine/threonine protein phosphatase PrpC